MSGFDSFLSAPIPAVDPDDIKRVWSLAMTGSGAVDKRLLAERCSTGANVLAVWMRAMLIKGLMQKGLLEKWRDGDTLEDRVFAVGATAPMTPVLTKSYPPEGAMDFDGDAFLAALE